VISVDVVIVGAGIIGCSTAFELSKSGLKIEVIEKHQPGAMGSGWTLAGVRQSGRHYAEIPLAKYSVDKWSCLNEILDHRTNYKQEGNLRLARNTAEDKIIQNLVKEQKKNGLEIEYLKNTNEISEICPSISENVISASYCPTDGHADPIDTLRAYKEAAQKNGVIFTNNEEVLEISEKGNKIEYVRTSKRKIFPKFCVLANGIFCNNVLKSIGKIIPIEIPIVTVIQTEKTNPLLKPVIGVANASLAMRQENNGCFRISSGFQTWKGKIKTKNDMPYVETNLEEIKNTITQSIEIIPQLKKSSIKSFWGGLIDLTPDALPVIDHLSDCEGLIVASGFSGHGFGIAPAVGGIVSDLVLNKKTRLPIDPFSFHRFQNHLISKEKSDLTLHG
jgi:sarcosine oxidase subunit beta